MARPKTKKTKVKAKKAVKPSLNVNLPTKFKPAALSKNRYVVYYGGRGGAKCLGKGTEIIMYDGTLKKVEDIVVDDLLMGPDSKPRKILSTASGVSKLYKVKQTNFEDYIVNKDHILSLMKSQSSFKDTGMQPNGNLRRPRGKYPEYSKITNMNVVEFMNKSSTFKNHFHGYKTESLKFKKQKVDIDPYFLGLWLGDGNSNVIAITTMDSEIVDSIYSFCKNYPDISVKVQDQKNNRSKMYHITGDKSGFIAGTHRKKHHTNSLLAQFKKYNLINNKHIPQNYIGNSESVRLNILAGLLDTDGHCRHNGYTITQKNERLLDQIKLIADTLGFKTNKSVIHRGCQTGAIGKYFKLSIDGDVWKIPCRIKRKIIDKKGVRKNKDFRINRIDIEPIGKGKYYGFEIDGDHLFCLKDGTVTHNTYSFAIIFILKALQSKCKILCCREIQNSIRESVYETILLAIDIIGVRSAFTITQDSIICKITGSSFIFSGLFRNQEKIKSIPGINYVWLNEADKVSEESLQLLFPTIREEESQIFIEFNPKYEDDPVYKRFVVNTPPDCLLVKVGWEDNPFISQTLLNEKDSDYAYRPNEAEHIWEGKVTGYGGLIWTPPFDDKLHVRDFDFSKIKDQANFYMACDPHSHYYNAMIWAAKWPKPTGKGYYVWIMDEWPRWTHFNEYYSEIRKKIKYSGTLSDMSKEMYAIEAGYKVNHRYIDSRFAKGAGSSSTWSNNTLGIVQEWSKPENGGILFELPPEKIIDSQRESIKQQLEYNKHQPITVDFNEPSLFISPRCKNLIQSMKNHKLEEDSEKEAEKYKDFSDVNRILHAGMACHPWIDPKPKQKSGYSNAPVSQTGWMG